MTRPTPEYTYTEQPALQLFQKLGYHYYDASKQDNERESLHDVILINRLKTALKRINPWLTQNNLKVAIRKITAVQGTSLMEINHKIHYRLQSSNISVKHIVNGKKIDKPVHYIDYQNIENNHFLVVNRMRFKGKGPDSIPDIVVFLNGLPIAVLECKSPTLQNAAAEAINDLEHYRENSPKLFHYNQICAALYKVGAKYGAIQAPEIHYHPYKCSDTRPITQLLDRPLIPQDTLIFHLFKKENLLDIMRNFILFEVVEGKKIKKLPRYPQIRAVNKAVRKLQAVDKGGVVWHTQGSGKSLTMVYLAGKLRREELGFKNPTILIMTDRIDLDKQISDTFRNCGFPNPIQAGSIRHLGNLLRDPFGKTIMTTIQKFQETDENGKPLRVEEIHDKNGNTTRTKRIIDTRGQLVKVTTVKNPEGEKISEIRRVIDVPQLSVKKNVFVLVDEAHRSHYGFLAGFMRRALPNAKFFAFTGTPIDKENKSTLAEFYGGQYMDVYTIKESVDDGATLPIYYDANLPELHIKKDLIDRQFERDFKDLSREKKELLRQKASSLSTFLNARERIRTIAEDIIRHYREKIYPDGFKAMVVCHSREAAITYYEAFLELEEDGVHNFEIQVIMTMVPKKDPEKYRQLATPPEQIKKAIDNFKLPFGDESKLSKDGKKQFNNTAVTIVCDMLLTGYDVPIVQVMYLDKLLTEHNLLQAIARVNRTRQGKDGGFIVDYCGITRHLTTALAMFSEDLKPHEVMEKTGAEINRLEQRHRQLVAFFQPVTPDRFRQRADYIDLALQYLEPEDRRDQFHTLLKKFNKSVNILLPSPEALKYEYDFKLYNQIRYEAANMYVDNSLRISKDESRKIQKLVDDHLQATGISSLLDAPISIIDREKFEAEINNTLNLKSRELKIIHRIKHIIKINLHKDPEFYKTLSERLEDLIKMRKQDRLKQMELFRELDQIQDKIVNKQSEGRRLGFATEVEFAVYNVLRKQLSHRDAKPIAQFLFPVIEDDLRIDNWETKDAVQKSIRRKIKRLLVTMVPPAQKDHLAHAIVDILKSHL